MLKSKDISKAYMFLLFIGMLIYTQLSTGFYSDDEIGHFVTARDSITDLWYIFTYWSRPAVKIFYVIPSQFGILPVQLLTIFISLLTVCFTYKVAEQYKLHQKASMILLIGLQPLYFQLAFRYYTEIWAALAIILMLYNWNKRNYILLAIISSYAFAIRQELVIISLMLGVYFIYKGEWKSFLILGWAPLLLSLLGWIKTGDILWLVNTYMPTHTNIGNSWKMGFWVYIEHFFDVFGVLIGGLFLLGLTKWREYKILFVIFWIMFLFYSILAEPSFALSRGQGSTRHIIVLSPLLALFAGIGLDLIRSKVGNKIAINLPILIIPFLILSLILQEPPRELSPEAQVIKEISSKIPEDIDVYSNHVFISYYLGRRTKMIRPPIGDGYIIYDSHYGYRPAWNCTLTPKDIKNVQWLYKAVSSDKRFVALVGKK